MTVAEIEAILRQMSHDSWGLLEEEIPELKLLSKTKQSFKHHPEGDVATHTRLAIAACEEDCSPDLLWAALLHDIGKPATTEERDEKITAYKHEKVGAEIAEKILGRFQIDTKRIHRIVWAIKNHLFYLSWQIDNYDQISNKQLRFVKNKDFKFLLELVRVDSLATFGNDSKDFAYTFYKKLLDNMAN
ncbi:HDIG domain-containing protein [Desulfuromonas sp. KJ2020]|uniref:HDIG domain-containing metalloprotein n=1 Tax=Desulfuromonas sp. KJ2020 TaxID=2919173 RepID=UPI0020A786FC|nr:HDIG domain-containing metalloprotein [Desulfuromonas sp. KJ2020]MCP3176335.1 HDIG domain-containing protein [Desulfuromonas sp. KJ2020]